MSADRELLKLAAKAIALPWIDGHESTGLRYVEDGAPKIWNPLTDDGDALRLAAKLYLWKAIRLAHRLVGSPGCPDIYAATRRAIVRAAAEIGRAMP